MFLNLGTNPPSVPNTVMRFHATSFVRADLPLSTIDANIQYVITRTDGTTISTITDYTQTYCLMYRWTSQGGSDNAQTHIPAGTMLTVTLPQALVPYLYLAGMPYIQVPTNGGPVVTVPIPDYSLSGTQLELTTPIALDMLPNSICAPVRFLTPANDLTSTFVSLDFSQPLVYTEKPDSLLYGFTTDSLLFRVNTITSAFTLKGAQVDTTGLSVSPEVYERGQAVTYIATVYNQSYAPSSDYCMGITVPTNQYNPVESSNNSLPAFITAINPTNPNTVVYFQTEANVTALDIQVLKVINQPGVPSLQQYFNTVAVQNWTRYTGQALPGDVVMFIGCTPGVPQNSLVRIDYNVVVDVPAGADTLYTNDAVFNYDSSGANLEAQSNMVTIRNRIPEPIPIVKTPPVQTHPLENGVAVNFVAYFTAPMDPTLFEQFTITDVLHPSLTLDAANTTVVVYPNTPVAHTTALDPATNTLTIGVANTAQTAGKLLAVNIAAIVTDTTPIPTDPVYQQPLFYNTVSLTINDNPGLVSHSEPVLVIFQIPTPTPVPIVKAPATQTQPKENGTMIDFTLRFDAPAETRVYTHFTITDALPPSLTLDVADVTVTALPSTDVPFALTYDPVTNLVTISFDNTAVTAGKTILVTVPTTLTDITKIPASDRIENQARLTFNQIPALYSDSNTVEVRFGGDDRCQAITDLIQSIAMEQAALAHILNAEGEKIQRAIQMDLTLCQILEINQSVQAMINQVTMLERVLQRKLSIIDCDLCTGC